MHTANEVLDGLTADQLRRFWTKVHRVDDGCWEWRGAIHPRGYGTWTVSRADGRSTSVRPHRVAWYDLRGPIPDGLVLDHLCHNKTCVNPDHLDVVDHSVNVSRILHADPRADFTPALEAVLATYSPEGVAAWLRAWLDAHPRERLRMEAGVRANSVGLFAAEAG